MCVCVCVCMYEYVFDWSVAYLLCSLKSLACAPLQIYLVLGRFIYMLDIPKHPHTKIAQYADDTATYITNKDINTKTRKLQAHISKLFTWISKWRIKLNEKKKKSTITFTKRYPQNITP